MGLFITIKIDEQTCTGPVTCGRCLSVCPVNIFKAGRTIAIPEIEEENEDECTLCDLCIEACSPRSITILKEYE